MTCIERFTFICNTIGIKNSFLFFICPICKTTSKRVFPHHRYSFREEDRLTSNAGVFTFHFLRAPPLVRRVSCQLKLII